jgi:hypothetical protein
MDDMTAFEQRLAADAVRAAGPPQPVDVAAVFASATTQSPKWRFQSMFSATKFVVAGVIVALFGGFLVSGVLTQQGEEPLPAAVASPSGSPEAVPTIEAAFAPNDIASVIPRRIGDLSLSVTRIDFDEFMDRFDSKSLTRRYEAMYEAEGWEPSDFLMAEGVTEDGRVTVTANRVRGVLAAEAVEVSIDHLGSRPAPGTTPPPEEWIRVGDRDVRVYRSPKVADDASPPPDLMIGYYLFSGEVVYILSLTAGSEEVARQIIEALP